MTVFDAIGNLPVSAIAGELADALQNNKISILKAPPGSGKSTALAAFLIQKNLFPDRKIIMLEPRRIACRMVAERIAFLLGEKVGGAVGYRMRGEKKISSSTRFEVVTEGIFTRMIQNDMELNDYALVIFDEFHERNIHSDLGLALSMDVRKNLRNDLGLLVMSATLNEDELCSFLPEAEYFECGGVMFDTEIFYAPEKIPYREIVNAAYRAVVNILNESEGNILVFMPGAYEIETLAEMLFQRVADNVKICPLYGALPPEKQQKAIAPSADGERKIVIATNIAESSVTIDDIRIVVDCGWEKRFSFNSGCGMNRLESCRISQSSAIQRGGRAGRTSSGRVYRLYTRHEFEGMREFPPPEIADIDLSNFCLELAMWGCKAADLDFLTPPAPGSLAQSEELLRELGLIDEHGKLTPDGYRVGNFPGSCRAGKMFYTAGKLGLEVLGCEIAAMLEQRKLVSADLQQSLEYLRHNPSKSYKKELEILLRERGLQYRCQDIERMGEVLFSGFPDRVGKRRQGSTNEYQLANGRGAVLTEAIEGRAGDFIIAPLLDMGDGRAKVSGAAVFDRELLTADKLHTVVESRFDGKSSSFITEKVLLFNKMEIERKQSSEFDAESFRKALVNECRKRSIAAVFELDEKDLNFWNRCRYAHFCEPENYADVSENKLLDAEDFFAYLDVSCRSIAGLKKVSFPEMLKNYIGYDVFFALERDFPEKYLTPGGAYFKIRYEENEAVLSVPVSEMYGTTVHPVLGRKKLPLKIELLSPAMRPVQITGDLPEFWRTNWSYVQKEMKQRYIKHYWPDDPANALPGRSIRKK